MAVSHLVSKILLGELDALSLALESVALECGLVLRELLEQEEQQLVVVASERQVARERLQTTD